jgi:hypothetical protein
MVWEGTKEHGIFMQVVNFNYFQRFLNDFVIHSRPNR